MAEVDIKVGLFELVKATEKILHLVHKNRIACDRPPANGYDEMWADAMERLEDIELLLEGKRTVAPL